MAINETPDSNRDPITGAPGSHPVGTGVGATGGAVAGGLIGAPFGPIGMLIGGAIGAAAGGAAGHSVAERIDPTTEAAYWREHHTTRPYYKSAYDYETDYAPAYAYGSSARARLHNGQWDDSVEAELREGWEKAKSKSRLAWDDAKAAVRDAWDRDDRTYRAYDRADSYYATQYSTTAGGTDRDTTFDYETDYRPAYRYGTYARSAYADRQWDDSLETDLERGWDRARGASRMNWNQARGTVKDAWHNFERALPGDFDRDGR